MAGKAVSNRRLLPIQLANLLFLPLWMLPPSFFWYVTSLYSEPFRSLTLFLPGHGLNWTTAIVLEEPGTGLSSPGNNLPGCITGFVVCPE